MQMLFFLCGMLTVAFVGCITLYLVVKGIPAIISIGPVDFLMGIIWKPVEAEPEFGILPFVLTSIYGTAGAVLCGVPIGLVTAVFLAKAACSDNSYCCAAVGWNSVSCLRINRDDCACTLD